MTSLSTTDKIVLARIREYGGIERIATGEKKQPFRYNADNWGAITEATFQALLDNKYIKAAGTQTVLGLPKYFEVVR